MVNEQEQEQIKKAGRPKGALSHERALFNQMRKIFFDNAQHIAANLIDLAINEKDMTAYSLIVNKFLANVPKVWVEDTVFLKGDTIEEQTKSIVQEVDGLELTVNDAMNVFKTYNVAKIADAATNNQIDLLDVATDSEVKELYERMKKKANNTSDEEK